MNDKFPVISFPKVRVIASFILTMEFETAEQVVTAQEKLEEYVSFLRGLGKLEENYKHESVTQPPQPIRKMDHPPNSVR